MDQPHGLASHIRGALHELHLIMDGMWHKTIPDPYRSKVSLDEIVQESKRTEEHLTAALTLLGENQGFDSKPMREAHQKLAAYPRQLASERRAHRRIREAGLPTRKVFPILPESATAAILKMNTGA